MRGWSATCRTTDVYKRQGIDYMEFGYKASKELFDVNKFGEWKFCDEAAIREIVGDNNSDMKISVMADVGSCLLYTSYCA